jgi:hypothetical protein
VVRSGWLAAIAMTGCGFSVAPAASDAPVTPIDAPFDVTKCVGYKAAGTSLYKIDSTKHAAWVASANCAADNPGGTHLAVPDDPVELNTIQNLADFADPGTNSFWVGGVQKITATTISGDWLALTGAPLLPRWATGEPTDNDRGTLTSEVHAEQFVRIDRGHAGMTDAPGSALNHGSICECDGKGIDPVAAQAIADSTGI